MNTYNRHASLAGGLRASGGSWYFRTIDAEPSADCTVFVSAANRPVFAKFGFCLSGAGVEDSEFCIGVPENASRCDGRGFFDRTAARGEALRDLRRRGGLEDGDLLSRRDGLLESSSVIRPR